MPAEFYDFHAIASSAVNSTSGVQHIMRLIFSLRYGLMNDVVQQYFSVAFNKFYVLQFFFKLCL